MFANFDFFEAIARQFLRELGNNEQEIVARLVNTPSQQEITREISDTLYYHCSTGLVSILFEQISRESKPDSEVVMVIEVDSIAKAIMQKMLSLYRLEERTESLISS